MFDQRRRTDRLVWLGRERQGAGPLLAVALAASACPVEAHAEEGLTPFTSITVFGDSYADRGNATSFAINGPGAGWPRQTFHPLHTLAPFTYQLQQLYGISDSAALDYAVAGATSTGHLNPALNAFGYQDQVNAFLASGGDFGQSDLIAQHIGGNDGVAAVLFLGHFGAAAEADGRAVADTILASFGQLVDAGARNVAVVGSGDPSLKPLGLPGGPLAGLEAGFNPFYEGLFDQLHQGYAQYADAGVRVFFFELRILEQRLIDTPEMYGYASINEFFLPDGLHPTPAGALIFARYVQNQMEAPGTVGPQGDVAESMSRDFTESLLGRLHAHRTFNGYPGADGSASGWSVWADGGLTWGSRNAQFYARGFDYDGERAALGLEYRSGSDFVFGLSGGYSGAEVDMDVAAGQYDVESLHVGGYASFTRNHWFADFVLAYGRHGFDITRPGVIDVITADTDADTFAATLAGGYLFDLGSLQVGPIAGVSYVDATIDPYAENGDALVAQIVEEQSLESTIGSLGAQIRVPIASENAVYSPYVNLTAERDLTGAGRTIITTQVTTPLIHVRTPLEDRDSTYGRVSAGVAVRAGDRVDIALDSSTTFARDAGDDSAINARVRLRF